MENSKLDSLPRELSEDLENGSIVAAATSPTSRHHARVFHHDVLEIGRRNPDAPLGLEHGLHDRIVVIPIGEDAEWDGAGHSEEDT